MNGMNMCSDLIANAHAALETEEKFSTTMDYYPGFLGRSALSAATTVVGGLYVSVYDYSYCSNIAHTIIGSMAFWSVAVSALAGDIAGVHFLALENELCYNRFDFGVLMTQAIALKVSRLKVAVLPHTFLSPF